MARARPVYSCRLQRVTSMAGMEREAMMKPFRAPQIAPTTRAAAQPSTMEALVPPMLVMMRAAATPDRFMMPTRDRSMPPAIMQIIMPKESTPYSGNWKIMERRFEMVK